MVMVILLCATAAQAEETGLAQLHSWVKVGRKTCMADHYHSGTGHASTREQAERQAIQSWSTARRGVATRARPARR